MSDGPRIPGKDTRRGRIVVLGMHRSGTSCVGELLAAMGAYFDPGGHPRGGNMENPHGLFERPDLRHICHVILRQMRADWWATSRVSPARMPGVPYSVEDMLAPMLADLNAHEPWFIKEPRLCLLLPMLRQHLGDVVAVRVWRDPLEVAESLRKRDAMPIEFGIALWERYVRASFGAEVPGAIVGYSRLIGDPPGATQRLLDDLTALGIAGLRMPDTQQLARVIDPSLDRSRPRDRRTRGMLTQSQQRLLAALERGDPSDPELAASLSPEQHAKLGRLEEARRRQMADAAFRSLSDARRGRPVAQFRVDRAVAALRYVPLNPIRWLRWLRHGRLGQRLQQQLRACAIAASGAFDSEWYARTYPDVAKSDIDPLLHFVRFGAMEGRDPSPSCSTKEHLHRMLEMAEKKSQAGAGEAAQRNPDYR